MNDLTLPTPSPASAYCLKCRSKVEPLNLVPFVTKNGRQAFHGLCPTPGCGTKVFRIGAIPREAKA